MKIRRNKWHQKVIMCVCERQENFVIAMIQRTTKKQGYGETLTRIVNSRRVMWTFSEVNSDSSGKYLRHRHNFSLATINAGSIHVGSVLSRLYDCASENSSWQAVLAYMIKQNRPYSVQDVFQNIGKDFGKTAVTKVMEGLTTEGKLKEKVYGKQKVYVADQSQFPDIKDTEILVMDQAKFHLNAQNQKLQEEINKLESELRFYQGIISTECARLELGNIYSDISILQAKLAQLKEGRILISKEEKDKVIEIREKYVKEWRKRKRISMDIINSVLEGYPKTKKQLFEEVGIETDEDYNITPPAV
ncbi:PSMC3 interacting protein [Bulinus truncatus]|nr:PSMC3 interacting protein [Bulinus truncatus]